MRFLPYSELLLVKVKVLFFAGLREQLGTAGEEIELPAGVATVGALRAHLERAAAPGQSVFAEEAPGARGGEPGHGEPGAAIRAGDEVAFFPPVTGG